MAAECSVAAVERWVVACAYRVLGMYVDMICTFMMYVACVQLMMSRVLRIFPFPFP